MPRLQANVAEIQAEGQELRKNLQKARKCLSHFARSNSNPNTMQSLDALDKRMAESCEALLANLRTGMPCMR